MPKSALGSLYYNLQIVFYDYQALEKYRKSGGNLKCKQCVQKAEAEERQRAAAKREAANASGIQSTASHSDDTTNSSRKCTECKKDQPFGAYNKNQWNKGEGKSKCRACVERLLDEEAKHQSTAKGEKLKAAKEKVRQAKESGNSAAILRAESELSALEAEQVTGLKPVKLGRGGGRGRGGRSGGRGRGRISGRR